jgi:hypothetical protein
MFSWLSCRCGRGTKDEEEITADKADDYSKAGAQDVADIDPFKGESVSNIDALKGESVGALRPGSPCKIVKSSETNTEPQDTDGPVPHLPTVSQSITGGVSANSLRVGGPTPLASEANADPQFESDLPEDIAQVLLNADQNRRDGYIFVAETSVLELINRLVGDSETHMVEKVKATQIYQDLIKALTEVNAMLQALLDDDGWTLQKEADRIWVWTKPEPGSDVLTVRLAGIVDGSFDHFCSIGKEVDLIKNWMPGVKTSYTVKQLNLFDYIGYYVWKFPFVSAREFLIEEHSLINDPEGYCVVQRQAPAPREGLELPSQKGAVRASMSNWFSFCAPCGGKSIFAITVMNLDLKIPLPTRMVNYLSISMGFQSFKELRTNVQKSMEPKSPLYQSVQDPKNSTYYGRLRSLEKVRETKEIPCRGEILKTGWVKDPADRRRIFNRSSNVLVPLQ